MKIEEMADKFIQGIPFQAERDWTTIDVPKCKTMDCLDKVDKSKVWKRWYHYGSPVASRSPEGEIFFAMLGDPRNDNAIARRRDALILAHHNKTTRQPKVVATARTSGTKPNRANSLSRITNEEALRLEHASSSDYGHGDSNGNFTN